MIHGVMPRSLRSLVLKGYTNTSLEELKWIRYAADRLQAWTWRGRECESQTSDKKTPKPTNFTFLFHLQLHTKCTEMHHYWEGKSAECVSSGGGTGRQKGKTSNMCTCRNHLRSSQCSGFSRCPQTQHPHRFLPSTEHWQGLKATAFLNLLICSWYS